MKYIEGKLQDDVTREFRAHLNACPSCWDAYADEVEMTAVFRTDASGIAGVGFVDDVTARLIAEEARYPEGVTMANEKQRMVVAVSLVALIIVGLFFWLNKPLTVTSYNNLSAYLVQTGAAVNGFITTIGFMFNDLTVSVESVYRNATTFIGSVTTGYSSVIAILTAIALMLCIGLIGVFRDKIVKELGI